MALRFIVLDTGVLGLVTHPSNKDKIQDCKKWFNLRLGEGWVLCIPEIADYELRRKLLHLGSTKSLNRLDELIEKIRYLPITTEVMRKAAEFWAEARKQGKPTAPSEALDGDIILAAQTVLQIETNSPARVVVATDNVGHLEMFVNAKRWQDISGNSLVEPERK